MCKIETIRRALGVSMAQMAQAVGLSGINAADHLREMERGNKPVSGPMQIVLKIDNWNRLAAIYGNFA